MAGLSANLLRYITREAAASTPDAVLLHRFVADRDDDAFAALIRRHGPIVYRVCRRLLGPTAADDAFQATFLVLATRARSVRKAGSLGSWLIGVAGRVARQMHKAERRRVVRERAAALIPLRKCEADPLESAEQVRILEVELTRLSDRLRGPLVACLFQGRTYEQAAAELGGSARTVRRRVDEAKRILRARLERRGVLPAAAAGLVAGIGAADAAVPAGLGSRTVTVINGFLAGGATIPAAVIAKGVAATMTTSVRMVVVLVATAAVGLTALGVGLAGDDKQTAPPAPPLLDAAAPAGQVQREAVIPEERDPLEVPLVPPSTAVLRAIEHEANHLRGEIGHRWFGPNWKPDGRWKVDVIGAVKGQPIPPPLPNAIRIVYWVWRDGDGAPTNAVTRLSFDGDHGYMTSAWADLCSDLTEVFDEGLPREMSHVVLGETLGKPVAWWAAQGMAADAVHQRFQFFADRQCRADLAAGRCVRLSALFELKDWPKNGEKVPAQCHSVVRFLLCRISYNMVARGAGVSAEQTFLNFMSRGREIGWDKAAKADYGFENVAAMEAAWLKWMKTKESRIDRPDPDAFRPVPAAAAPYPPLIPPVKLP